MEVGHQFCEVEVPRHLRSTELRAIFVGGCLVCNVERIATLLSLHSPQPLHGFGSDDVSGAIPAATSMDGGGRSGVFSPHSWCSNRKPQPVFYPLRPLATVAALLSTDATALALSPLSSSLLVGTHSGGVGCTGTRGDTSQLLPFFVVPHAVIVWCVSQSDNERMVDSLCRLVLAARLVNAQLCCGHPEGWETTRKLLLSVTSHSTRRLSHSNGPLEMTESHLRHVDSLEVLQNIPQDRRELLRSGFGEIQCVHVSGCGSSSSGSAPFVQGTERMVASAAVKLAVASMPLGSQGAGQLRAAPSSPHAALVPVVTPLGLSRYFAECAARMPSQALRTLPIFRSTCAVPTTDVLEQSGASAPTLYLRRMRSEFVIHDAKNDLRQRVLTRLANDAAWQPSLQSMSANSPGACSVTEAQDSLRRLAAAELETTRQLYFAAPRHDVEPSTESDFMRQSEALIEEMLENAVEQARELRIREIREKLLDRLAAVIPLLDQVLVRGRFPS